MVYQYQVSTKLPLGSTYRGYTGKGGETHTFLVNRVPQYVVEKFNRLPAPTLLFEDFCVWLGWLGEPLPLEEGILRIDYKVDRLKAQNRGLRFGDLRPLVTSVEVVGPSQEVDRLFAIFKQNFSAVEGFLKERDPELIELCPPVVFSHPSFRKYPV